MAVFSDGGSQQSSTVTKLTVIEESYSSIDNSSVVSWKLTMSVASWNFSGWSVTSKVWLDGSLIYNSSKTVSISKNSTVTLASGTKTIYHNDNGSKTLSCKAETSTSTSASYLPGKATPEGELKLTDISRQSQFDISNWSTNATPVEQAKSLKIIEGNPDYYTQLVVKLMQEPDSYLVKRKGIQDGTYNFQFTEEELNNIVYKKIPSNSRIIVFTLETYSDSAYTKLVGKSTASPWYTATIINANPIFNNFNYEDSNLITNTLTNDSNKIIPKYSTLKVTIPIEDKAIGQKGATITGYTIDNYSVAYSDSEDVVKEIPNYPNENIVVSAVDSRGNSTSITKLFTDNLINYTDIVILNCEVNREDEIGEKVKIKFDGEWWQSNFGGANGGGILNELNAIYQYQTGNGEFVNGTTPLTLNVSEFGKFSCDQYIVGDTGNGFNISNSYKIKVIVSDKLSSIPKTKELIAGEPAIAIFGNKVAFHGKYDESRENIPNQFYGDIDVQGNFTINGKIVYPNQNIICVTNSALYELTKTNVYEQIQNLVVENQLGSDLSLVDNAIVIGEGISKILVNFSLAYDGVGGVDGKFIRLSKNEVDNAYRMISKSNISTSGTQNYRIFMDSGEVLIDVVKGDKIMLFAYGTAGDTIPRNTYNYFIFTVRAVA